MFLQFQYDQSIKKHEKYPVLLIMDEFAQLKHFPIIKNAMSIIASYGMRIMIICQTLGQLKEYYGEGMNEFLSNATNVYFGASGEDAKTISERMGTKTVVQRTKSADGKISTSEAAQALMTPDEVAALPKDRAIIFFKSQLRPTKVKKVQYYTDSRFKNMFDERPKGLR